LWIVQILSNLQLSLFMLLTIALVSLVGSVIEQNQSLEFYKRVYPETGQLFNIFSWKTITKLELHHVFENWWFLVMILFFAITIIACTFSRQLPILKIARNIRIYQPANSNSIQIYVNKINNLICNYILILNKNSYSVFQGRDTAYGYKGILGRISPVIVHISMLLILGGSSISFVGGFIAQEMVPKGEYFHIQNIVGSGSLGSMPQDVLYKVKDFWIDYNDDLSISQFYSTIQIYDNKSINVTEKIISVNKPLKHNNIVLYQTDWDINGIRLEVGKKNIQIPVKPSVGKSGEKIWVGFLPFSDSNKLTFLINRLDNKIYTYDNAGLLIQALGLNDEVSFENVNIRLLDVMTSSGIQIKNDPGIPAVYGGFLMLMLSSTISYLSFTQIWINKVGDDIFSNGYTNRSVLELEGHFNRMIKLSVLEKSTSHI